MNVEEFVSTIYLGDRACKGISIDTWTQEMSVHVDTISRIRSPEGMWDFYTSEDVENGQLVFGGVKKFFFDKDGNLPNDYINSLDVSTESDGSYRFRFSIDSVKEDGENNEVVLEIVAETLAIRDPKKPDTPIVD